MTHYKNIRCGKCFKVIEKPRLYQCFCDECAPSTEFKDFKLIKKCKWCGKLFRKTEENSNERICPICENDEIVLEKEKRKESNIDIFLKKKEPKPREITSAELNRRLEIKRAFSDKGWSHYLKGRKWDKI